METWDLGNLFDMVYRELGDVVLDLAVRILRDTHFFGHVILRIIPEFTIPANHCSRHTYSFTLQITVYVAECSNKFPPF